MSRLNNVVMISNSIPKSGSSFLFILQTNFIEALVGKSIDYTPLKDFGIDVIGGFVKAKHDDAIVDFLRSKPELDTPLVLKMHTSYSEKLAKEFVANKMIFISLAVRDPIDIFQSARRNFFRTGEFPMFADVEHGTAILNRGYKLIYERTLKLSQRKAIPIIRYEDIVNQPIAALRRSFDPDLHELIFSDIARKYTDMDRVMSGAAHRRSTKADRHGGKVTAEELEFVRRNTQEFRKRLGY